MRLGLTSWTPPPGPPQQAPLTEDMSPVGRHLDPRPIPGSTEFHLTPRMLHKNAGTNE